jgi:hypothetical protein
MPVETAFHQPVGKKLLPSLLAGQLGYDAFHREKRKRGMVLNQQNC